MDGTLPGAKRPSPGLSLGKMLAIVAMAMLLTMAATLWLIKLWLFPAPIAPVALSPVEEQHLQTKLDRLAAWQLDERGGEIASTSRDKAKAKAIAAPTPYSEDAAARRLVFSERELNAIIGNNPRLSGKAAVDLSQDLVSVTLLIPTKADAPIIGGQAMRVKVGLTLASRDGRPVVALRGVSMLGVPMPNAWLGTLKKKNIDLVKEYGADGGFWRAFADGVERINIEDGQAEIILKP
ncbi:MAG: arginine N-succinyltransferase [Desulfobulbaceae bacterium]|jgi:hypothetical protein|nr:arginine N-succinyltransferase [Desulfobulbaceae bacterium]